MGLMVILKIFNGFLHFYIYSLLWPRKIQVQNAFMITVDACYSTPADHRNLWGFWRFEIEENVSIGYLFKCHEMTDVDVNLIRPHVAAWFMTVLCQKQGWK